MPEGKLLSYRLIIKVSSWKLLELVEEGKLQLEKKDDHLTNSSLEDGVKPALWCISIARYHLLLHLLVKTINFVSQ